MKVLWQVEIDEYATKVLEKHWPNVARFRDVRDCGKHNLKPVDLICGGFPCQDVSLAGKRAGLEGKRTTLWSEFARIIGEIKPQWVLAENVPGLLSSDSGRFFGNVLRDLAACGYDAEWDCIPAAAVGAPHRRDRVFIVAYAKRGESWKQAEWQGREDSSRRSANSRRFASAWEKAVANATSGRTPELYGRDGRALFTATQCSRMCSRRDYSHWATEPDVGRVANGVSSRVDRLRCLGNAVVPQVAEWIGRRIAEAEAQLRLPLDIS